MIINLFPGVISCIGYAFISTITCMDLIGYDEKWLFNFLFIFILSFGLNLNILLNGYNLRLQEEINERKN